MADRWIVSKTIDDKAHGTLISNVFASSKNYHTYEQVKQTIQKMKSTDRVAGNQSVTYEIWLIRENGSREKVGSM